MKKLLILPFAILFSFVSSIAQEELPPLNQKIVNYVKTTIGTKVNRGECWDLAAEALNQNDAIWDWKYEYGDLYNPKKTEVLPGDLIQFENVKLEYTRGNITYTETMGHHTAIVYRVIDQEKKIFELAHQNTDFSGRKVGLSEFDLGNVTKGEIMFYRPIPMED
jgi:hypothetical protein